MGIEIDESLKMYRADDQPPKPFLRNYSIHEGGRIFVAW